MRKTRRSREKIKAKKAVPFAKTEIKKELTVSAIEEGTVIDHIPTGAVFKVVDILHLDHHGNMVSIATNLKSKSMGSKGIVKVGGKSLTQDEVNKIAIVAPDATVNMIKNFEVREKIKVKAPDFLENVVRCSNPVCITNNEQVTTKFYMVKKDPLKLKCHYCERIMGKEDLEIL